MQITECRGSAGPIILREAGLRDASKSVYLKNRFAARQNLEKTHELLVRDSRLLSAHVVRPLQVLVDLPRKKEL